MEVVTNLLGYVENASTTGVVAARIVMKDSKVRTATRFSFNASESVERTLKNMQKEKME